LMCARMDSAERCAGDGGGGLGKGMMFMRLRPCRL
jgi:hypothetical protein